MLKCYLFGRVAWLPASREARLGRRVSDCVVASKVVGWVGGCYNDGFVFGCVVRLPASWEAGLGRLVSDCVVGSGVLLQAPL